MEIVESERPVSEAELDALESKYGFTFPHEYRAFLLKHNGGRPAERAKFNFLDVRGPYTDSLINWFLAVYDGEYDNFERTYRVYKVKQVRMPLNLIPIADDPFGNAIGISVSGDDNGSIYFWDHEKEYLGLGKNLFLLAGSFNEFLARLA